MKLNREFLTHTYGDESLLVPTSEAGFSGLIQGNKTLGVILELLANDTTEQEIVDRMYARFEAPREVIAEDVANVLQSLRQIGALDE